MKLNNFWVFAGLTAMLVTMPSLSSHALEEISSHKVSSGSYSQSIQTVHSPDHAIGKNCCLGEGADGDSDKPNDVDVDAPAPAPAPDPAPAPAPTPAPDPEPTPGPAPTPDPDPDDEIIRRYYECWTNGDCEGIPGGNEPRDTGGETGDTGDTGDTGIPTTDSGTPPFMP